MEKEWKSIYLDKPRNGSLCVTRRSGEDGTATATYSGETNTFRAINHLRNRIVVTIWKNDEWRYAE